MVYSSQHHGRYGERPFEFRCGTSQFTEDELATLSAAGARLEGLASGHVEPCCDEEQNFLRVHRGEVEPANCLEKAWVKLIARRLFEADSKRMPFYRHSDPNQDWFSDDQWWGNNPKRYDG